MAKPSSPAAGGVFIALGAIAGAVLGFGHQSTLWFLGGLAAGIVVAVLIWLRGR